MNNFVLVPDIPRSFSLDELPALVNAFITYIKHNQIRVIALTGTLGAGKTTFVRELLRQWGVTEVITSPTFTYVNSYRIAMQKNDVEELIPYSLSRIYHFDAYRITQVNQFSELGFDEYLVAPYSLNIIEWPAIIDSLLKHRTDVSYLNLEYIDDTRRELRITQELIT